MEKILKMVAQRLALGLLTLFVVSLIIFSAVELLPGDLAEAILGQSATPETVAAFRRELKLDLPAHERYVSWLWGILQGDMGRPLANQPDLPERTGRRLANTPSPALFAAFVSLPIALPSGHRSLSLSVRPGRRVGAIPDVPAVVIATGDRSQQHTGKHNHHPSGLHRTSPFSSRPSTSQCM